MFALTRVKLDTQIAEHEILIKSIYKKLTKQEHCRTIGGHWGDIGFQGSDPKTDVRGAGILGLIHILYFIDYFPQTAQFILSYS
jgi:ELMO domain-containing protein